MFRRTRVPLVATAVAFAVVHAAAPARNPNLMKIEPDRWVKIHEPKEGEATFRRQPHGGSCFDSRRGRLILFGSDSHGRDFSNSPRFFSPVDLKWSRAYDDDPRGTYDVAPDGQRFLMLRPQTDSSTPDLKVVVNWYSEL